MKKILSVLLLSVVLFSCKKSDDDNNNNPIIPTLLAGRAATSFTTNADFSGSRSFTSFNESNSSATSAVSSGTRSITLSTRDVLGSARRFSIITITLPETENTTTGSINANLANPSGATVEANITLYTLVGTTPTSSYNSNSGSLIITKLTSAEIEGNFVGNVSDGLSGNLGLSNGTFAGKF